VGRALAARGCQAPPDYSLASLLPPTLGGLETAAGILADCIEQDRRIVVVGDFDADGATGTALAIRGLKGLGATNVRWRMPDRFRHGYGLGMMLAEECLADAPSVVVTVDHGISSNAGVEFLRSKGVDVVVTDHHLPGPELPNASAIVNPNCPGDEFPSRNLAGVGVMFYTLIALRGELRRAAPRGLHLRLDLAPLERPRQPAGAPPRAVAARVGAQRAAPALGLWRERSLQVAPLHLRQGRAPRQARRRSARDANRRRR
jgi:single-stranded-DNA-specific exonuclease